MPGCPTCRGPLSGNPPAQASVTLPTVNVTQVRTTVAAPGRVKKTYDWVLVTVKHPGMLAALKHLTGRNFGYDKERWEDWIHEQRIEGELPPSNDTVIWETED